MSATLISPVKKYQVRGFFPIDTVLPGDIRSYLQSNVAIVKGDVCHASSGYATAATVAITQQILGVAASSYDNSGGSAGDVWIPIIVPRTTLHFIVPVEAVLITRAAVGNLYDLGTYAYSILISATATATDYGFKVDDIDVSAGALKGCAYGYAIGHFDIA
jgi:hypothetical protein